MVDQSYRAVPGKLPTLDLLIHGAVDAGEKIIVWTSFTENADLIGRHLAEFGAGIVHGGLRVAKRDEALAAFKADPEFLGAEYANHDGRHERRDITQPCLCVYGTTTPLHFWNALQSANVVDGSLARFIILPTEDDYPEEAFGRGIRTAPKHLVQRLRLVAAGGGRAASGNLAGLGAGATTSIEPMTVRKTPEAAEAFRDLASDVTKELRAARGTTHTALLARIGENAQKLALIAAVSRDPVAPAIQAVDAEWSIGFIRHFAHRTVRAVDQHVADNEIERNHKKMLDIIRCGGRSGLTRSELTRKTQFLDRRTRDEALLTLTEAGLVTSRMRPSATRPTVVLVPIEGEAA